MNAELCRKALEKVGNPNVLINIISRRVRQLSAGGGGLGRPLIPDTANLGAADIALREVIEEKRSEERRVGKECTSWCRSRWSPYH